MYELRELNVRDIEEEYAFIKDIPKEESGFENPYYGISFTEFATNAISERLDSSRGIVHTEGYVPDTWYILYVDNTPVSLFHFRHYLNDYLKNHGGHIGYFTTPMERNKGYAKIGLSMLITVVKPMMIPSEDKLYFEIQKTNIASRKVLLSIGAYSHHTTETSEYFRLKIK